VVQHDLSVELDPDRGQLKVSDRIRLPEGFAGADGTIDFFLNAAFEPSLGDTTAKLELLAAPTPRRVRGYRVHLAGAPPTLTIIYSGKLAQSEGAYEFGHIGPEGVFLTETSAWYPLVEGALVTFSMRIRTPEGWTAISQGAGDSLPPDSERAMRLWRETRPQTEIVLLAGRFIAYANRSAELDARVYLRSPDAALAERYLDATAHYVQLYEELLGPYPYDKFALVENFWETGYGLPSLALLGPRVIRFPFILHSSFPHEILHNWWGNGVYLSSAGGNWSEGLTAYLADHLVQEQRGRGADHRRSALQKYASYVAAADDFPLSEFRGKHGEVSQAVGYNKALMFFHMLRQRLGDANFLEGLRLFAARHPFQPAGYDGLRRAFEAASGAELSFEFEQWVERTGAPSLRLSDVNVEMLGDSYRLKGVVTQQQPGAPYRLRVPVAVQLEGRACTWIRSSICFAASAQARYPPHLAIYWAQRIHSSFFHRAIRPSAKLPTRRSPTPWVTGGRSMTPRNCPLARAYGCSAGTTRTSIRSLDRLPQTALPFPTRACGSVSTFSSVTPHARSLPRAQQMMPRKASASSAATTRTPSPGSPARSPTTANTVFSPSPATSRSTCAKTNGPCATPP
jgi:hypothetical protein